MTVDSGERVPAPSVATDLRPDVQRVLDRMSDEDWRAAVWLESGNYIEGGVDPADRRRIVEQVLWMADLNPGERQ